MEIGIKISGDVSVLYREQAIQEFEIADDRLLVYTTDHPEPVEHPLEDLDHLAVSTDEGSGVAQSAYLNRHEFENNYMPPKDTIDVRDREL